MKVGITLPNLGIQATRDNIIQTATQAEKEGFESYETSLVVKQDEHKRFTLKKLAPGKIKIIVEPYWANVYIGKNRSYKIPPIITIPIDAGTHMLMVIKKL